MKSTFKWSLGLLLAASIVAAPQVAFAQSQPPEQTLTMSDGSQVSSYSHCGDLDLCAIVAYKNGNVLSIYSEGAAYGQPYSLHVILTHGDHTIYEFSRRVDRGYSDAELTLDRGNIHMDVNQNDDGTLTLVFAPITKK